jgi:carboxymethylenebutenolidase
VGERIEVATGDRTVGAYLALPPGGRGPGLVVIQEWWGLVPHIESLCERFAAEGYVALAPDLYAGRIAEEPDEAARRMQELQVVDAAGVLVGAIDHLLALDAVTSQQVGLVGFCMGGALALVAANEAPDRVAATVPFYAVFWYGEPDLSQVASPVLMHIGAKDEAVPVERVEEVADRVRAAGAPVSVLVHEGAGHAFMNDGRPEAYAPEVAAAAWQDTIEFLRDHLG